MRILFSQGSHCRCGHLQSSTKQLQPPQLNGNDSPWYLRFHKTFDEAEIPFGAKVLFWNNPARADNQAGKTSPTSNEGVFLGYHIQPGFAWKGEFLVAKLEGLDYHIEHASLTVQRTKRIELPTDEFIFPMRLLKDPASHPPVADARTRNDAVGAWASPHRACRIGEIRSEDQACRA